MITSPAYNTLCYRLHTLVWIMVQALQIDPLPLLARLSELLSSLLEEERTGMVAAAAALPSAAAIPNGGRTSLC